MKYRTILHKQDKQQKDIDYCVRTFESYDNGCFI